MKNTIKVSAPLPLKGANNVRDLGGYPCAHGVTRDHMFLRSDGLHEIVEADREYMYDYGVRCVIDLRTISETEQDPNLMQRYRDVAYVNVPLKDDMQSEGFSKKFPVTMGAMYINLLDNSKEQLRQIFAAMADYPNSCVLFNCRAGKDRTGTVAMLILKLAQVHDDTVAEDYAVTEINMKELFIRQKEQLKGIIGEFPDYLFMSKKEDMYLTLRHLKERYETAENYLREAGVTAKEIDLLKEKIMGGI